MFHQAFLTNNHNNLSLPNNDIAIFSNHFASYVVLVLIEQINPVLEKFFTDAGIQAPVTTAQPVVAAQPVATVPAEQVAVAQPVAQEVAPQPATVEQIEDKALAAIQSIRAVTEEAAGAIWDGLALPPASGQGNVLVGHRTGRGIWQPQAARAQDSEGWASLSGRGAVCDRPDLPGQGTGRVRPQSAEIHLWEYSG